MTLLHWLESLERWQLVALIVGVWFAFGALHGVYDYIALRLMVRNARKLHAKVSASLTVPYVDNVKGDQSRIVQSRITNAVLSELEGERAHGIARDRRKRRGNCAIVVIGFLVMVVVCTLVWRWINHLSWKYCISVGVFAGVLWLVSDRLAQPSKRKRPRMEL